MFSDSIRGVCGWVKETNSHSAIAPGWTDGAARGLLGPSLERRTAAPPYLEKGTLTRFTNGQWNQMSFNGSFASPKLSRRTPILPISDRYRLHILRLDLFR